MIILKYPTGINILVPTRGHFFPDSVDKVCVSVGTEVEEMSTTSFKTIIRENYMVKDLGSISSSIKHLSSADRNKLTN